MTSPATGPAPDRCPGVFATHSALDGELARIRVPGGVIGAAALEAMADAADEFGDGGIEITVRGNLQVRGIPTGRVPEFAAAVTAAGLVRGSAHDRVRNIAMSPLTGRVAGTADLRPVAPALHAAIVDRPWSSGLSGRFWFGLDDGRGDVLAHGTDVTGVALDGDRAAVVVGGRAVGEPVRLAGLAEAMVAAAGVFVEVADGAWRVADLDADRTDTLYARLGTGDTAVPQARHPEPRVGWFTQTDGRVTVGAVVPFGRLTAEQARYVAAIGTPVTVTPEREILVGDLDDAVADTVVRVLAPLGFVFDARSPWTALTACIGSSGCGKSLADVRGDLRSRVADLDSEVGARTPEHWVGCARGCGSPARTHVRVLASSDGYVHERRDTAR
ncbi:precorrin-3B synthase [Gordonia liuliyuniae]|uniref:Precorrin-3B synthase n=1 Tax=Gordonia liuliyuniae TaxID=2911517 RepID=A0ABS9IQP1_9ACTN|nr:precorrin-3B synthase [Gordonia liuliyuniae]MCF8587886.1 precorrin-3B synthase [Gordonia liuliyuniae]